VICSLSADASPGYRGCVIPDKKDRTPQALQSFVESEVARWSSVLKAAGATAN
jgi:hypothetical protein